MASTERSFSFSDYDNRQTLTAMGPGAHRGQKTIVRVGQVNGTTAAPAPLIKEGLYMPGRVIAEPDFQKEISNEEINTGSPAGYDGSFPITSRRDLAFTFDMFKLVGWWLAHGTDAEIQYNYVDETTISSATRKGGTVAAAGTLAKKQMVIVDTADATYGGFKEMTFLTSVSGTTVEFDPPLDHVPADTSTFKSVAGNTTGTDKTDTGIYLPDSIDIEYPRVCLVWEKYIVGSRSRLILWYPECEVLPGSFGSSGNLKTASMTFRPIQQPEETVNLHDGSSESRPVYGRHFWVPFE